MNASLLTSRRASSSLAGPSRRNTSVVCRCDKTVFQLDTNIPPPSLREVKDAWECCALIPEEEERRGCYAVFGVDSEQAGRYFTDVVKLEGALEQTEQLKGKDLTVQVLGWEVKPKEVAMFVTGSLLVKAAFGI